MSNGNSNKCKICGAPLPISKTKNGICKCEWCRAENYVSVEPNYQPDMIEITCLGDTERHFIRGER
jgi:hypothetical protein